MILFATLLAAGIAEAVSDTISTFKRKKPSQKEREREQQDWQAIQLGNDYRREDMTKKPKKSNHGRKR